MMKLRDLRRLENSMSESASGQVYLCSKTQPALSSTIRECIYPILLFHDFLFLFLCVTGELH
jgi:hypothetical protein